MLGMVRFAPADPFDDETPAADPRGEPPVATPGGVRASSRVALRPTNPLLEQRFRLARPPKQRPASLEGSRTRLSAPAPVSPCWIKLFAAIRRSRALRQRSPARRRRLRRPGRHREIFPLRDAEHLSPAGAHRPAGACTVLARIFGRPVSLTQNLRYARICSSCARLDLKALAEALHRLRKAKAIRLPRRRSQRRTMQLFCDAPPPRRCSSAGNRLHAGVSRAGNNPTLMFRAPASCRSPCSECTRRLTRIWLSPNRAAANRRWRPSPKICAQYQEAVDCLLKDRDALLTFFDFPESIGRICALEPD